MTVGGSRGTVTCDTDARTPTTLVVIGGGVAGCAAAVAAAATGATVVLCESTGHLGGVAARGEHRTLCGLAAIDATTPELLEAELTGAWLPYIATGAPYAQGRVWLWPTAAERLQAGLRARLDAAGVHLRLHTAVTGVHVVAGSIAALRIGDETIAAQVVIDASGAGAVAALIGAATVPPSQWPAWRGVLHLPTLGSGKAERVRALATAQHALGTAAALALTPLAAGDWQLSLDVPPGTPAALAAAAGERIADALGGTLVAGAIAVAHRDDGRPAAQLGLDELFASHDRGLCWAAWPREEHGSDGITWTWPPADRHGVPERAAHLIDGPANLWLAGRGLAVSAAAASALRVTGTALAIGAAVGLRATLDR